MTSLPPPFESRESTADDEHLRILSICHYVLAALSAVGCCGYGAFSIAMSSVFEAAMANPPPSSVGGPAPAVPPFPPGMFEMFGKMYVVIGTLQIALGIAYGIGHFLAGRALSARRSLTLCYVVAGFACVSVPLGTVLGVFTFVVLSRSSVQAQFAARRRADAHGVLR